MRSSHRRGFTLLEISIALVLIGLMTAVAVPSLNAVAGTRLKEQTNRMSGAIRDTYARTALLGRSTRLVLDIDGGAWWVEETEGVARVKSVKEVADRDGKVKLDALDDRIEDIDADTTDVREQAKLTLFSGPVFKPVEGEWGQPQKLPPGLRFKSIWIEHLDDRVTGGSAALFFFPGGYTEEAIIALTDDEGDGQGGRVMSLVVQPLTGEVDIEEDEPRVPNLEGDD